LLDYITMKKLFVTELALLGLGFIGLFGGVFIHNLLGDILLRNGNISLDALVQPAEVPAFESGELILVNFSKLPDAEDFSGLKSQGLKPIHYIPENTWICRVLTNASASDRLVAATVSSSVIWKGKYQKSFRLHNALQQWLLAEKKDPIQTKKVRLIFAKDTPNSELLKIEKLLENPVVATYPSTGVFVSGTVSLKNFSELSENQNLLWAEPAVKLKPMGEVAAKIVGGDSILSDSHYTHTQELGYDGKGVVTAVADTGIDSGDMDDLHPDLQGKIKAMYYYGGVDSAMDEYGHGTHVTGSIVADGNGSGMLDDNGRFYALGLAMGGQVVCQRVIDKTGTLFLTEDFEQLAMDAYREGVSVVNNSWGAEENAHYDSYAAQYDALVRDADVLAPGDQAMSFFFAAGNSGSGSQTVVTPGVAKNVVTVGASQSDRQVMYLYEDGIDAMADFSSRGPTGDGRIKPDFVAPGTWIASTRSSYAPDGNEWMPIDGYYYTYMGGTSMASPIATGAAAVVIQYFRDVTEGKEPSPALLKALMMVSCVDMDNDYGNTDAIPNNDEGWGRLYLPELIDSDKLFVCENQSVLLKQGEEWTRKVFVSEGDNELKILMAYTDVPGLPAALPALVNDLDLEVTSPTGDIYYGNSILNGESCLGGVADRLNNVEGFILSDPIPGAYTVKIKAFRVISDARVDTAAIDQDFAVVISGDLAVASDKRLICPDGREEIAFPESGLLALNKVYCTAPDVLTVTLYDSTLPNEAEPVVTAFTSDVTQRNLVLKSLGNSEFSADLPVNILEKASGNEFPVADGDVIQFVYSKESSTVRVSVNVDMVPPKINEPEVYISYGKVSIYTNTDEDTQMTLHYGQDTQCERLVSILGWNVEHEFIISGLAAGTYYFYLEATDRAGNSSKNDNQGAYFTFELAEVAHILLVDGCKAGSGGDDWFGFDTNPPPLSGYTDSLDSLGYNYDLWSLDEMGELPLYDDLCSYDVVIWRANDLNYLDLISTDIIPSANMNAITQYVNGGGNFFLSSMEILSYSTEDFRSNVLHVKSYTEDSEADFVQGVSGDSIGNGLDFYLDYSEFPRIDFVGLGPDLSDAIVGAENTANVFVSESGVSAIRYPSSADVDTEGKGRVVFFAFPIDAIPMDGEGENRTEVFKRVLGFLCPGMDGIGSLNFDKSYYTVPSMVWLEVADSDLVNEDCVTITVKISSDETEHEVQLYPELYPGVFKGFIALQSLDYPVSDTYLRGENGDTIEASYFDQSLEKTVMVSAVVDTEAPVISDVQIELDYMDGIICWTTSKEADSTVEFGSSFRTDRSAYDAYFGTEHEISVLGLIPNKDYYFRIISRDMAGNVAVDDNDGALYCFRTPTPLETPWFDDVETENPFWIIDSDDSTIEWGTCSIWERGVPSGSIRDVVPGAYSGQYCFGVNLKGEYTEAAITALFSPAIYLAPSNRATLSFATAYNMVIDSEYVILNAGELSISADNGTTWTTLYTFSDSTMGEWEELEFDISNWIGQTVRFQWYYNFLSIFSEDRPGWYIDDICVTTEQVPEEKITLICNLESASWKITGGRESVTSSGTFWTTTGLVEEDYTVTWGNVPWYKTPDTQTLYLEEGSPIVFKGIYQFDDENNNNISDEWEIYYFEHLLEKEQVITDNDGDGFSDYAEFIAGTDPTDAASNLSLVLSISDNSLNLRWKCVKNRVYSVECSADSKHWSTLEKEIRATSNGTLDYELPMQNDRFYYRIKVAN